MSAFPLQENIDPTRDRGRANRLAIYTHDTYGMGHIRRCFNIIEALCAEHGDWPILLISGSPALSKFDDRPSNVDILKLPTLAPTGEKENQPPHLPLSAREIISIRKRIINSALQAFEPDVFLVDNFPLGARKELMPCLKSLRGQRTRKVLGLRDIVEDPGKTCQRWKKEGVYDVLDQDYDDILIYGHQHIFDAGKAYDLPGSVREKLTYCGYVTRPTLTANLGGPEKRKAPVAKSKHILVTVGGGGDGLPMLDAFLAATTELPEYTATVVAGPMMGGGDWQDVQSKAAACGNVELVKFIPDLVSHMRDADIVICMGGYNTSAELLALGRRAIIVPRDWRFGQHLIGVGAGEEKEQILRARAMEARGYARLVSPADLSPETLLAAIKEESTNQESRSEMVRLDADGAQVVAALLAQQARKQTEVTL